MELNSRISNWCPESGELVVLGKASTHFWCQNCYGQTKSFPLDYYTPIRKVTKQSEGVPVGELDRYISTECHSEEIELSQAGMT